MTQYARLLALTVALAASAACGSARHVAVQVDYAFAQAVFAADDAEFAACQSGALSKDACDKANPVIKAALLDVKAATAALQATPKNAKVPVSIPDLLQHLSAARAIIAPLESAGTPQIAQVTSKLDKAIDEAIKVIRVFAGGL